MLLKWAAGWATCPRIAILSATNRFWQCPSGEAAEMHRAAALDPRAEFAKPLSFDLAVSPKAAAIKGFEGPVSGSRWSCRADIVSGNILFKSIVWFGGGLAAGWCLVGQSRLF